MNAEINFHWKGQMRLPSTVRRSNHFRTRETRNLIKPEENLQKNKSVKINNAGLEY